MVRVENMDIDGRGCLFHKFVHKENERNKVTIGNGNKIQGAWVRFFLFYFLYSRQDYFCMLNCG